MSDGIKREFDKWHAGLNKIVSAKTGETVKINDPLDTPIVVLSAGETFNASEQPLIIQDAMTGEEVDLT